MIVFITGSESTGKTRLAKDLAAHFEVTWVPEYARSYIESLNQPYQFGDVEQIAREQIRQIALHQQDPLTFFDTGLVITRIWFKEVFRRIPEWFDREYAMCNQGAYLLCYPDIAWQPDPVRENEHKRVYLHQEYHKEITKLAVPFQEVKGTGPIRLEMALKALQTWGIR